MSRDTPPTFVTDVVRLAAPVPGGAPGGVSVRSEPLFSQLREARRADDATTPRGAWQTELKRADWALAERIAREILETRSKDLLVAAWLMEAWIHLHGAAGAAEGLRVLHALCEDLWEHLHPPLEEDDPEVRDGVFHWINERVSWTLASVRISAPQASDAQPYSWNDWRDSLRREETPRAEEPRGRNAPPPDPADPSKPTRARVAASVTLTPRPFYEALVLELDRVTEACARLRATLDARQGRDAPTLARLADTAAAMRDWTQQVLADKPALQENGGTPRPEPQTPEPTMDIEISEGAPRARRAIATRDEAYRQLREAADYLMRTEPHSPTPFLVNRAVAWGGMSLGDLLMEFARDGYDLKTLRSLLGMNESAGNG